MYTTQALIRGNFRASTHSDSRTNFPESKARKRILTHCLTPLWLDLFRQWVETLLNRQTDSYLEKMGNSGCFELYTTSRRKAWVNAVRKSISKGKPCFLCVRNKLFYQVKANVYRSGAPLAGKTSDKSLCSTFYGCVAEVVCEKKKRILTKNGLYPAEATGGTAPRGPAAGGSTGRPEEKMPRELRFKPGIKLACCCAEEE